MTITPELKAIIDEDLRCLASSESVEYSVLDEFVHGVEAGCGIVQHFPTGKKTFTLIWSTVDAAQAAKCEKWKRTVAEVWKK